MNYWSKIFKTLVVTLMLVSPSFAFAAIAQTNTCSNATSGASTNCTVSVTGSNTMILATISGPSGATVSSITAGGNAMTLVNSNDDGFSKVFLYYYVGASGSTVVSYTLSAGNSSMAVSAYSGVSQLAPEASAVNNALGTDLSIAVTTVTANAWAVMGVCSNQTSGGGWSNSTNWTLKDEQTIDKEAGIGDTNAPVVTPGSITANAHYASGSARLNGVIASIAPATAAAATFNPWQFFDF